MNQFLAHMRLPAFAAACLASATVPGAAESFDGPDSAPPVSAAYSLASPALDAAQRQLFDKGGSEFRSRWVPLFNIGGNWGRGPTSNAEACSDCHAGNGRGRSPDGEDERLTSILLRLSVAGTDSRGAPLPHPAYGLQLQEQGVLGKVPPEGRAVVTWQESEVHFADGESVTLRRPQVRIEDPGFGAPGEILVSARVAPPVFGLGLLEAVSEETLLQVAQAQKRIGLGGRLNRVWDEQAQAPRAGRFGWKATQPTITQQAASAFLADIGVTTPLYPDQNCPPAQLACRAQPAPSGPEQNQPAFDALVFHLRALAAPARRMPDDPTVTRGEALFERAQCSVCHLPELRTGDYPPLPQIANRVIYPYTDLLLHDMGDGLADNRPEYLAGGRDWRTPPLWGLGQSGTVNGHTSLLHDGRARNAVEAILWHGGEAAAARETFRNMTAADREALTAFLASL